VRIGKDFDADRRSGVVALGLGLEGSPDVGGVASVANLRISTQDIGNTGPVPRVKCKCWAIKSNFIRPRAKATAFI
jgi:hypothetical protein